MLVTMAAARMVQVSGDEVVDVVAMRDSIVTASWSMLVSLVMAAARMVGRA